MNVIVCVESPVAGPAARAALGVAQGIGPGTTIVGLSAADADAGETMQAVIAARCSRAILLSDPVLDETDYLALADALAATVRHLRGDLVLMGTTSAGEGLGAVPAAVARALGYGFVARAESLRLGSGSNEVVVTVRTSDAVHHVRVPLPAVLTIPPGATAGRRRTRTNATPPEIEIMTLQEVGLHPPQLKRQDRLLGERRNFSAKPVSVNTAKELIEQIAARGPGGRI